MTEDWIFLMYLATILAGGAIAGLWTFAFVRAAARRNFGDGGPARALRPDATAGTGRVMLGAAFGAAMGAVTACGGLLGIAAAAGGRVELPEAFLLFLLAIPVGIVVCPGLALWGLVAAWRVAEQDPDGHGPDPAVAAPPPPGGGDGLDALDAPFAPPPTGRGGDG
ncbi:hypothetical protein [Alienimonas californiensis]|uniref:Uncharacterized protein n=1 Tax=Alienimonas californiensis TaxID=2527989 RepID=A0A517P8V1_9PLAN|nr:hypothetical protein [Alienimonas californiensis]QDT15799.1 hypothetical protein CA12_18930 [Alienimonas californiensis]